MVGLSHVSEVIVLQGFEKRMYVLLPPVGPWAW